MQEFNEYLLIQKSKKGDRQAFGELVLNYADYLYSVVIRIVNNESEAEDIAQESFIKAWQCINTFNIQRAKFSTWLFTIATRKAIDVMRRNQRELKTDLDEMIIDDMDLEQHLSNKEIVKLINHATNDLSEKQKVVLVLRDFEDLSVEEVVEITGYTEKQIKDNLYVARKKVRKKLEKHVKVR